MPFLRDNLFLVHIPKTAGSSIEIAFNLYPRYYLEDQYQKSFSIFARASSVLARLSGLCSRLDTRSVYFRKNDESLCQRCFGLTPLQLTKQHLTLNELFWLGLISPSRAEHASFVSVVRNPLDRFISVWKSHGRYKEFPDINDFVHARLTLSAGHLTHDELSHVRPMHHYLDCSSLPFSVQVEVVRFEDLKNQWLSFGERYSMNSAQEPAEYWPSLQRHGKSPEITSVNMLTDNSLKIIQSFYAEDYCRYGYPVLD